MEDLPYREVMSQPLFHSWQIQHMGRPISWETWARQGTVRLQHLRDIILSGAPLTQPALQQEVTLLLDSMPASWAVQTYAQSWDPTRPWHPRHMRPQAHAVDAAAAPAQPQPQPESAHSPHLVGAWSAGIIDPTSWGFGSEPAHEYVVRTSQPLAHAATHYRGPVSSMQPAIWPAEYADEYSGIRRLESRWAAAWDHCQQLRPQ